MGFRSKQITALLLALLSPVFFGRSTRSMGPAAGQGQAIGRANLGRRETVTMTVDNQKEELSRALSEITESLQRQEAESKDLLRHLQEANEDLVTLNAIARVAGQSLNTEAILQGTLDKVLEMMGLDGGGIYCFEEESSTLRIKAFRGLSPEAVQDLDYMAPGSGITGRVFASGQPTVLDELPPHTTHRIIYKEGFRSVASVPLWSRGKVVGAMSLGSRTPHHFTERETRLLATISDELGIAIDNATLYEKAEGERLQLKAVIDTMPMGVMMVDAPDGRVTLANRVADEILGGPLEADKPQLSGKSPYSICRICGEPYPFEETPLGRSIRDGEVCLGEEVLVKQPGGQEVIVQINTAPLRGTKGRIVGGIVVLSDITQQKAAESRMRALLSERTRHLDFLEKMVTTAPVGVAVVRGPEHRFEMANPLFLQQMQIDADVLGRPLLELCPDSLGICLLGLLGRAYPSGPPQRMTDVLLTVPGKGSRYFSINLTPLAADDGQAAGILILIWDTTDEVSRRKQVEELASLAEQKSSELMAIISSIADGVYVCDLGGNITIFNDAWLAIAGIPSDGRPKDMAAYRDMVRMRYPDGRDTSTDDIPMMRALKGEVVRDFEGLLHNGRTNRDIFIRVSAAPVRGRSGDVVAAVAVISDVTAVKELERLKDEFISIASHELRSPLAIIKGYSQHLLKKAKSDKLTSADTKELELIAGQVDAILGLVNDLLNLSRIETGRLRLHRERADLVHIAERAISQARKATERHEIIFRAEVPSAQGLWDTPEVRRVVTNLLDNAMKYSPEGGRIWVTVGQRDGYAILSARDEGVGIPKEDIVNIFEKFRRTSRSRSTGVDGFGLGLHICRSIIEMHGGRIWAESEEGKGSTFYFTLPQAA